MQTTSTILPNIPADFSLLLQGGTVYFIGIGGIGMSALAKYFLNKGCTVYGYDKTATALTAQLSAEGAIITYTDVVVQLPKIINVVIYTPAIPTTNRLLQHFVFEKYTLLKRSEVLGMLTATYTNICVAGTHGKTTVSAMIAHLLQHSGYGCNAFLGGISVNYNTNFISSATNVCVIEADEYDRSFLQLSPTIAVVTSVDADHLDIYGTAHEMENAFIAFTQKIKKEGKLIVNTSVPTLSRMLTPSTITYNINNASANAYASNIVVNNGTYTFTANTPSTTINNLQLNIGGLHNIENMLAAILVAKQLLISDVAIVAAVASYSGVKRRFNYVVAPCSTCNTVVIDDYAHHPTELQACLNSVKNLFPHHYIIIIFQPHLYSRTRDFAPAFSQSLSLANEVVLLPIYPARELPITGITSDILLPQITTANKQVINKDDVVQWVKNYNQNTTRPTVIVIAGAGDIDTLVNPIKNLYS